MKNKKIYFLVAIILAIVILVKINILSSPSDKDLLNHAKNKISDKTVEIKLNKYINSIPVECTLSDEKKTALIELIKTFEVYKPDPNVEITGDADDKVFNFLDKEGTTIVTFQYPYIKLQKRGILLKTGITIEDLKEYIC